MDYQKSLDNTIFSCDCDWEGNSYLSVELRNKHAVRICANREGLITLANHLLALAERNEHCLLYEPFLGDLEEGSLALEIDRVACDGRKT